MTTGSYKYGRWEDWTIAGIVQRFRWIPPGEFMMGSPDDEADRWDDEGPQHLVELNQGFWLADTACTQALWQAVMGENPSRFKGPNRPVETVSWDDCRRFIARLNQAIPGLEAILPTEAQWEYACRAGTTTPFWFGQTITSEQVNYDGNYPYQGGAKGLYRKQTVEVKSLPPNGWGLYEMHGNVWEWCRDRFGDYGDGMAADPRGTETGTDRVLRGGSWYSYARDCRSAARIAYPPGNRSGSVGLRLSRGRPNPVQKPDADSSGAASPEAERSEAGAALPGGPVTDGPWHPVPERTYATIRQALEEAGGLRVASRYEDLDGSNPLSGGRAVIDEIHRVVGHREPLLRHRRRLAPGAGWEKGWWIWWDLTNN